MPNPYHDKKGRFTTPRRAHTTTALDTLNVPPGDMGHAQTRLATRYPHPPTAQELATAQRADLARRAKRTIRRAVQQLARGPEQH